MTLRIKHRMTGYPKAAKSNNKRLYDIEEMTLALCLERRRTF